MTAASASKPAPSRDSQDELRTLLLAQKSELIGELAQATANQFSNLMMAITGYAELELKKTNAKDRRALEQVLAQATHATSLIQKLLDFSRKHTPSPKPLELDSVVTQTVQLLKELCGTHTELVVKLGADSGIVHADRVDVEQALFVLILIARNAAAGTAMLTLSTSLAALNQEFIGAQDKAEPGNYVVVSVDSNDTTLGRGSVHEAGLDQSQRVSLSLEAVRGIVEDCRGLVRFSNEPGGSSSFKVFFPASGEAASDKASRALPRNPAVTRTILVVEDDDAVRMTAAEYLMMQGFKVLQARTGSEALNLVQQSRSPLDILITDIFMPKMNGHEVAAKLLEEHPDLKVLYMSGDPGRSSSSAPCRTSADATLRKPFPLNTLRDKIHDLLGE
jgi:two-component system, cell cycle sensor histidine kinase and response regulator CckA